nr:hypothetical protein [Tanacetum cinerariifolium]
MVDDDEDSPKDKGIDKLMALISLSFKKIYKPTNNNLRTSSNTSRANQDNSPRIHRNVGYEGQRSGTVASARETVGSSMIDQNEKDADLAIEQANNKLSEVNDQLYADYKKSKVELQRRNTIEYASEMELECAK